MQERKKRVCSPSESITDGTKAFEPEHQNRGDCNMSMDEMKHCEEHDDTASAGDASGESYQSQSPLFTNVVPTSKSSAQLSIEQSLMSHQHSEMSALELNAAAALCSQRPNKKASKKHSPAERLQRSRERNRMHARKTRQRKKEQMQVLQGRVEELKQEQIQLKQNINDKQTASILVGLYSTEAETLRNSSQSADPLVEELLLRPLEDIPDTTKIPELPALILPGNNKKSRIAVDSSHSYASLDAPNDGIDYDLLGKDRSKCSAEELDRIRRERNRMHAKRTRDRKRIFMDKMEDICKKLESENALLLSHLLSLDGEGSHQNSSSGRPCLVSPSISPSVPSLEVPDATLNNEGERVKHLSGTLSKKVSENQLTTLLEAAGSFCKFGESRAASSVASAVSASTDTSVSESGAEDHDDNMAESARSRKRRRMETSSSLPLSITTTTATK